MRDARVKGRPARACVRSWSHRGAPRRSPAFASASSLTDDGPRAGVRMAMKGLLADHVRDRNLWYDRRSCGSLDPNPADISRRPRRDGCGIHSDRILIFRHWHSDALRQSL
ncbi:hypothetical protein PsYK624_149890 [Phanerochaete sordida]|uniref:Uncharacterized protein n=1 Tax=Phanerochaete sordida TaxID=48140 RepID=A0A9P3GPK8_9APHY|nr:hypothetical protein PsYK624_149890 [Phanerochaete sordida]